MAGRTGHLARPEGLLNWQQRAALWTDSLVEDHLQEIDAALRTSVGDVLPAEIPVSLDSVALDDTSLDKQRPNRLPRSRHSALMPMAAIPRVRWATSKAGL
ncbi:MAG: hypothetical protein WBY44_29955 [Bryobacteraceae bacterium]